MKTEMDFKIHDEGTIVQVWPLTSGARTWFENSFEVQPYQHMGDSICIDHRFANDVIALMVDNGFNITCER